MNMKDEDLQTLRWVFRRTGVHSFLPIVQASLATIGLTRVGNHTPVLDS